MRADQLEVGQHVHIVTTTDEKFGTVTKLSHRGPFVRIELSRLWDLLIAPDHHVTVLGLGDLVLTVEMPSGPWPEQVDATLGHLALAQSQLETDNPPPDGWHWERTIERRPLPNSNEVTVVAVSKLVKDT